MDGHRREVGGSYLLPVGIVPGAAIVVAEGVINIVVGACIWRLSPYPGYMQLARRIVMQAIDVGIFVYRGAVKVFSNVSPAAIVGVVFPQEGVPVATPANPTFEEQIAIGLGNETGIGYVFYRGAGYEMVLLAVEGGSRPGNVLRIVGQVFNRPFVTQRVVVVVVRQVNGAISRRYTHRNGIMVICSTAQRNGVVAEFNFLPFAMGQLAT